MRKILCTTAALAFISLTTAGAGFSQTDARQACSSLSKLGFAQTEIVQAAQVEAGALVNDQVPAPIARKLPAFCRVVAIAKPSPDSDIKIEVWLPLAGWNGKFLGQGNGGFAGVIGYQGLALAVLNGFASGGTDTGHTGGATDSDWALHHPEKTIDFGYRGVHLMSQFGEAAVKAFYATSPKRSYFSSCSDGGREALMEAQRFPDDYDGIVAGAPAYNWTGLMSRAATIARLLALKTDEYLPFDKVPALSKAVLAACHKDEPGQFLADPRSCHFSPDTLVCKGADTDACLTQPQADLVKALYAPSHLKDGALEYPGQLPGAELGSNGWQGWITGKSRNDGEGAKYTAGYFANMVYSDPHWDIKTFDLDRDLRAAQQKTGPALDAVNPDLKAFKARGGKLILYHGWNDPAISPLGTIDYYNNVVKTLGQPETDQFVRLFLVPGMQHCAGGPGPSSFGQFDPSPDPPERNVNSALEAWVEKGTAPEQVLAQGNTQADGKGEAFSQPICAWPKAAQYRGSGDRKDAASYTCSAGN
jgi:hypothetical protein